MPWTPAFATLLGLKRWRTVVAFVWAGFAVVAASAADSRSARTAEQGESPVARLVIIANAADPDSLRVARHYAAARQVPVANIIALPMPLTETVTWRDFIRTIWSPLIERLVRDRWIDAIGMDLVDAVGRRKYAVHTHRIAALVTCRGVPLRIDHDPALYADVTPYTTRAEFRTNAGAVDAELALLASPNYAINAFVPNPFFQNTRPTENDWRRVVKVARLDGPTAEDAMGLVTRALLAERDGLVGRAYVDFSDRDEVGNRWLESTLDQLNQLGFDVDVDRMPALMPPTARIDAPALYFGWYTEHLQGPFALPGFRFAPGAIALHIHSYSAVTLRSDTRGWTGPLVARGVTATVGNVNEPYLQWTHRPDLLLRALAKGETWVDAGFYSLQALSWQQVLVGDPLYRPFAVPLEQQLATPTGSAADETPALRGYAIVRRARELEAVAKKDVALDWLRTRAREERSPAVALALAEREFAAGSAEHAVAALGLFLRQASLGANDWGLWAAAAERCAKGGRPDVATTIWQRLLSESAIPRDARIAWLRLATRDAHASGDAVLARQWELEAVSLAGP